MVLLSLGVHFVLAGMSVAYFKWGASPLLSLTPVTSVDLVGFIPEPPRPATAEERPSRPVEKPRGKKSAPKEPAVKKEAPPARSGAMPLHDAKPDPTEVSNLVKAMRDRKLAEANAGKAIADKRAQQELSERLKKMRDRAAHQINLAAVGPETAGMMPTGVPSEASEEQIGYSRALKEKIKDNWTQPVGNAKGLVARFLVKIQRDGYVPESGVEVYITSGDRYFDDSVKRAIMKASPLPVPPEKLRAGEPYYQVLFNFHASGDF
jgi:colicin import membrane protein